MQQAPVPFHAAVTKPGYSEIPLRASRTRTQPVQPPATTEPVTQPAVVPAYWTVRRIYRQVLQKWRPLILGMLLFFALLSTCTAAQSILATLSDQYHYGDARVSQLDADVGHHGVSHFLALYYHGSLVVTETSDRVPQDAHIYTLPIDPGDTSQHIVTLSVRVINGKRDLVVQIPDSGIAYLLSNDGDHFDTTQQP